MVKKQIYVTVFNAAKHGLQKKTDFAKWAEGTQETYWNKIVTAVNETKGKVITYMMVKIINAFFHANSGGKTKIPANVWGGYRPSIFTSSRNIRRRGILLQYSSAVELIVEEFINKFRENILIFAIDMNNLEEEIKIQEYTESGRLRR